jgi:hypothetical protein
MQMKLNIQTLGDEKCIVHVKLTFFHYAYYWNSNETQA